MKNFLQRLPVIFAALALSLGIWAIAPAAEAFNAPELLPNKPTAVIDLDKALTSVQEEQLSQELGDFEAKTGWKLRVLTQFDRTPGLAVKDFWGIDEKSILLVADSRGGNILNFHVGDAAYQILHRTFWVELQTRYGNRYFVRDHGEDQSIIQSLESIKTCLQRNGCLAVPGLPREHWILTLIASTIGGIILGFVAHPREEGQVVAWQWALIFSPLWGMLLVSFGIAPVVVRTAEWLPLFRNIAGFMIGALAAYLSPLFNQSSPSET